MSDAVSAGRLLGAHTSTAGGLLRGIEKAGLIGAEVIQIFGSSPRSWVRRAVSEAEIAEFREAFGDSSQFVGRVYIHACYLINFGSKKPELVAKSIESLLADLELADRIGAYGVVIHPGSLKDGTTLAEVALNIKQVLSLFSGKAKVIVENSAGGGTSVPRTVDEVVELVRFIDDLRVEVCIDTAHLWGFGVDISAKMKVEELVYEIKTKLGEIKIPIVHFNDSKAKLGSLLDRHENIGLGQIGLEGLREMAKSEIFAGSDLVLEVPGLDGGGPDRQNMEVLKQLIK